MEHLSSATLDAIIFLILPTFVHKNNSLEISRFIKGQKKIFSLLPPFLSDWWLLPKCQAIQSEEIQCDVFKVVFSAACESARRCSWAWGGRGQGETCSRSCTWLVSLVVRMAGCTSWSRATQTDDGCVLSESSQAVFLHFPHLKNLIWSLFLRAWSYRRLGSCSLWTLWQIMQ